MPLEDFTLLSAGSGLPAEVRPFVREAERRIKRFRRRRPIHGFIPSDYERAYQLLRALTAAELAPGKVFCEWGSGFGVVACLAALLGFTASGIEIEGSLVEEAKQLAADFKLAVRFGCGSFLPGAGDAYSELGRTPADFDVIFAYTWPEEEARTSDVFEQHGRVSAVLATYHGVRGFRLRRKTTG